jgi:hypothetical protein
MVQTSSEAVADTQRRLSMVWSPFARTLASVLGSLESDQYLLLRVKRTNRFVQFAAQGAFGMRVETNSHGCLAHTERLNLKQIEALRAAGWHAPIGSSEESIPDQDPDGSPNFYVAFPAPVPVQQVAELAVHTLAEILHVPNPVGLDYEAFDAGGAAILLPSLGLKRAARAPQTLGVDTLPARLLTTIRETMGLKDLKFGKDGDIGFGYGGVVVYVRLAGDPPYVRMHAWLRTHFDQTTDFLSRLTEINSGIRYGRFLSHDGTVYAVADVHAEPFVSAHLAAVLRYFCRIADGIDCLLQAEFGGRTACVETPLSFVRH